MIPTFTWQASAGAAKYEIEVGPQSDPNIVWWSGQTVHLTLTPVDASKFPNTELYWRVRAKDSSNTAGPWSSKINFTKILPAPILVNPLVASTSVITPTFEWERVPEATYYQVELSTSDTFVVMEATYTTYNTRLTPVGTFAHGTHYWRVRSVDADGHVDTPSNSRSFEKDIPAPTLISPAAGSTSVVIPTFEWERVPEATYYKVELSTSDTFVVMEATYTTYNTRLTPVGTFAHGQHYWRVSSVDADGHAGTPSTPRSFTKDIPAPTLVGPADGSTGVVIPTFEWQRVQEATYYQVEVSTSPTFVPMEKTYTTYNTRITPVDTIAHGLHYWRVSSVDADGHVGTPSTPSTPRSFTKTIPAPTLSLPNDGTNLTRLSLVWTAVGGAAYYKVELSTSPTFLPIHVTYTTYNTQIIPVNAPAPGTYYWRVSGVDADEHVGAASDPPRRFTLSDQPAGADLIPQLIGPAHGAQIAADPVFDWTRVITPSATYYLQVSTNPSFSGTAYDSVTTDYDSYTPYNGGGRTAYANGTYYWRVKANAGGPWSEARSFTKNEPLLLDAPVDGATGLTADPTFRWRQTLGAHHYALVVSTNPSFSGTNFDSVGYLVYNSYTPYTPGGRDAYPNGTYYWKVLALTVGGALHHHQRSAQLHQERAAAARRPCRWRDRVDRRPDLPVAPDPGGASLRPGRQHQPQFQRDQF